MIKSENWEKVDELYKVLQPLMLDMEKKGLVVEATEVVFASPRHLQ